MAEQENIQVVQQTYENFKKGDIAALLNLYSVDVDWFVPTTENLPFTGRRTGRESVAEFFAMVAESQTLQVFEPREFIAQGDMVVVLGNYTWQVKGTGRLWAGEFAHVCTVRDGLIVAFQEYTDTAAAEKAHQKAAAA